MDPEQRRDWTAEKQRHVDEIQNLLNRLEGIMDRLDPSGCDIQVDQDEQLLTAALQHYRSKWEQEIKQIELL